MILNILEDSFEFKSSRSVIIQSSQGVNSFKRDRLVGQTKVEIERASARCNNLNSRIKKVSQYERKLDLTFKVQADSDSLKLSATVDGEFLRKIFELLHYGSYANHLLLHGKLHCKLRTSTGQGLETEGCLAYYKEFDLEPFGSAVPSSTLTSTECRKYIAEKIDLDMGRKLATQEEMGRPKWSCVFTLQLKVDEFDFGEISSLIPPTQTINNKIYAQQFRTDFVLIANDETPHQCHQIFLAAHSQKFLSKFQQGSVSERMNISSAGVEAFIKYIYESDVVSAVKNSDVAVDLYLVGRNYNIQPLHQITQKIILGKKDEWITKQAANRLFLFLLMLGNAGEETELKKKVHKLVL